MRYLKQLLTTYYKMVVAPVLEKTDTIWIYLCYA